MIQAWYITTAECDQKEMCQLDPPKSINKPIELKKLSGVLYFQIDVDNLKDGKLQSICNQRNYTEHDEFEMYLEMPEYEQLNQQFYQEHFHPKEESRLVLEGCGFIDIRDVDDNWLRVHVRKGDLIVIPAGLYHRFTIDLNNYIKVMRIYKEEPNWTAFYRPTDDHPARKGYLAFKEIEFEEN